MTLILIPGHLCTAALYGPQIATFADAIIADVTQDDTIEDMATRLLDTAPATFTIAGLSMGGMVAMEVMARAPDRVQNAILIATDPTPARPKEQVWRAQMQADVRVHGLSSFTNKFSAMFYAHDDDVLQRLLEPSRNMMSGLDPDLYHRQSHALNKRPDQRVRLQGCSVPTQIIVGAADRICPPKLHHDLHHILPNSILTEIPNCGHIVTLERPEIVTSGLEYAFCD